MAADRGKDRVDLGYALFDVVTEAEVCTDIADQLDRGRGGTVVTANLDHLLRCKRSEAYRELVARADRVVADGMPLIWASRLQRTPLPERVAGSSLCLSLAATLARRNRSLYLLGGSPGIADIAGEILEQRFPGLRIAGTHCPPLGFENDPAEMEAIRQRLVASAPDVVYVALGSPKQEQLIERLRGEFPKTWWMGVGISLSFIAGDVQRAPRWVQAVGAEWVHRLIQEPRRLARRYLVDGIPFGLELLATSLVRRGRSTARR